MLCSAVQLSLRWFTNSKLNLSLSERELQGFIRGPADSWKDAKILMHCETEDEGSCAPLSYAGYPSTHTAKYEACPEDTCFMTNYGDVISVQTILDSVGIDLDAKRPQMDGLTYRQAGMCTSPNALAQSITWRLGLLLGILRRISSKKGPLILCEKGRNSRMRTKRSEKLNSSFHCLGHHGCKHF